jgi:NADH-quinone oxidoreductase subunit E
VDLDFRLTILDFRFKRKMERTHYKQEINITEGLMSRINELISYYPEEKRKSALLPVCMKFKMLMTIG